ncbi:MAG: LysR family transcriptional regulator [Acinetobacter sp.]
MNAHTVMTFTQLEIFVLAAEYQSSTLAAKQLNITQSAVSHALTSLEKHWNVRLLIRGQNQVELTHISRQLLQDIFIALIPASYPTARHAQLNIQELAQEIFYFDA